MLRNFTLLIASLLVSAAVIGQTRYLDEVFTDVDVTYDITYGQNYSVLSGSPVLEDLKMDVYEPQGDAMTHRPVVILSHAGSFIPKGLLLPFGAKNDSAMIEMCTQLAKRGFVAVSMTYRIGWNPLAPDQETKASTIINAVYRAMVDARTAIRFLRKDAAGANTYGIDPYKIAMGGSNSGGYISLAVGTFNKESELRLFKFLDSNGNPFINTSVTGGFFGEGGMTGVNNLNHPGYSSKAQVILNLGGAIGDTLWMEADEPPMVNCHGILDPLTPYGTDIVIVSATGDPVVEVSGSRDVAAAADRMGINDAWHAANFNDTYTMVANTRNNGNEGLFPFPGAINGYEPWAWYAHTEATIDTTCTGFGSAANPCASRAKAEAYIDTVLNYFVPRALLAFDNVDSNEVETADPSTPVGIFDPIASTVEVSVSPNPASEAVVVALENSSETIKGLALYTAEGRLVRSEAYNGAARATFERKNLPKGLYFISIQLNTGEETIQSVVFK